MQKLQPITNIDTKIVKPTQLGLLENGSYASFAQLEIGHTKMMRDSPIKIRIFSMCRISLTPLANIAFHFVAQLSIPRDPQSVAKQAYSSESVYTLSQDTVFSPTANFRSALPPLTTMLPRYSQNDSTLVP